MSDRMDNPIIITGPFILGEILKRREVRIEKNYRKWLKGKKVPHPNPRGPKSLAILACILLTGSSWAAMPPTFQVKEVELTSYERHNDKLLYPTQPLYRLGEIMKVTATGQWVVPINRTWFIKQWIYTVAEVKVSKKGK